MSDTPKVGTENKCCDLYRHFDNAGVLLYVGVSLAALKRLSQHKQVSHWYRDIANVKIEKHPTRKAALAAEREAIAKENPLHNLKRPSTREVLAARDFVGESKAEIVKRICEFNPTYSMDEVARVLGISTSKVKGLVDAGQIGYVVIGEHSGRFGKRRKVRITGWQLIEFIENAQNTGKYPAITNP